MPLKSSAHMFGWWGLVRITQKTERTPEWCLFPEGTTGTDARQRKYSDPGQDSGSLAETKYEWNIMVEWSDLS